MLFHSISLKQPCDPDVLQMRKENQRPKKFNNSPATAVVGAGFTLGLQTSSMTSFSTILHLSKEDCDELVQLWKASRMKD